MKILHNKQPFLKDVTDMLREIPSYMYRNKIGPIKKFAELGYKPPGALKQYSLSSLRICSHG